MERSMIKAFQLGFQLASLSIQQGGEASHTSLLVKFWICNMSLSLNISPKLIKAIMTLYTDVYRCFFEHILNSIDAAKQFFDRDSNSYSKPIEIRVWIRGTTYKDTLIRFEDNATGIDDITKITSSLGDSEKVGNKFLNGQFGVGIYSFLAICNTMKIATKVANSYEVSMIQIDSDIFEKKRTEQVELGRIIKYEHRNNRCWTTITLHNFLKDRFKEFSIEGLKKEIETHFESVLTRRNITVSIKYENDYPIVCKPFDYSAYNGPVYEKVITKLEYTHGRKYSVLGELLIQATPIKIFLKVTIDKALDRKPFFVINGIRIAEISDIKAFRTYSKGLIWSHPNVTGYIDVTGTLEPTIARNEFKNGKYSRAVFQTLLKYEDEIRRFVESHVNQIVIRQFHRLESILNEAVSDLARQISKKERKSLREGKGKVKASDLHNGEDIMKSFPLASTGESETVNIAPGMKRTRHGSRREPKERGTYEVMDKTIRTIELPVRVKNTKRNDTSQYADSFGFNILIDGENEPIKDKADKSLRSVLLGSNIVIYKKHPEFMKRLDDSIHGIPKISSSLITYLCNEILLHYKSQMLSGNKTNDGKALLNDFLESLYYLEDKLSGLKNKRISDFT